MFTQLNPMLPVTVVGKGKGHAFGVIDYSQEHHLLFVIAMDESGAIWAVPNPQVRLRVNYSLGRQPQAEPETPTASEI